MSVQINENSENDHNNTSNDNDNTRVTLPRRSTEAALNLKNSQKVPFHKFVMTGGPCGGKTTGLARLSSFLRERGFEVISCPEVYTILASNGMAGHFYATEGIGVTIQKTVMSLQMSIEDGVEEILRARGKPAVMLCDRGVMDGGAYLSKDEWNEVVVDIMKTTDAHLRDNRYNAVFHMVTCASGAEDHYTLANNMARTESKKQACELDKKTQSSWVGHPHLYVFDNSTNFEGKMNRLVDVVAKLVGLPSNLKRRSAKFLLLNNNNNDDLTSNFPPDVDYHVFHVEKVYLTTTATTKNGYSFIRKRTRMSEDGRNAGCVYQLTNVEYLADGEQIENKRIITSREYNSAYMTRDRSRHEVIQKRISFIWKMQSFNIHAYEKPRNGLAILHAQVEAKTAGEPDIILPTFLNIDRRISHHDEKDEELYSAYSISIKKE